MVCGTSRMNSTCNNFVTSSLMAFWHLALWFLFFCWTGLIPWSIDSLWHAMLISISSISAATKQRCPCIVLSGSLAEPYHLTPGRLQCEPFDYYHLCVFWSLLVLTLVLVYVHRVIWPPVMWSRSFDTCEAFCLFLGLLGHFLLPLGHNHVG